MAVIVKMPQLGESIVEGTVARWLKAPGDSVAKFEPLLEITTDKIDTEIPAPASGILLEIVAAEGKTVKVGSALAHIGEPGEQRAAINAASVAARAESSSTKAATAIASPKSRPELSTPSLAKPVGRDFISPVVARIVGEHKLDLAQVAGSGASGRVTKKDVFAYLEQQQSAADQRLRLSIPELDIIETAALRPSVAQDEILTPLTAIRRAIAQHMVQSVQTSPHATTIFEVDMNAVVQHREAHKQALADKGIHLTYTPYFVAAVATALRVVPQVNSRFSEEGITTNRRVHIGVAVALSDGLIVPVIRDADEKNLQGLARAVNELAQQARSGKLAPDASKGGTFSITNHGVSGSLVGTPIINQPQAGILGIGAIVKRPVVRSSNASLLPSADDALVIRPMCYLSFSFDHRILDGAKADEFLTSVKEKLENWKDH